jgi:hypothetical protein
MTQVSEITELAKLVEELEQAGVGVDDAIATAERRLRMLRAIKTTLAAGDADPKPRSRKKKEMQSA